MTPIVSAIIPAFNASRWIGNAIASVLGQTYPRMEIIVVDDGSTDETGVIAGRFGSSVKYIRQENAGVSVARNRGVQASQGDFISFLDADDEWLPRKTEFQVAQLSARPDFVASSTHSLIWLGDSTDGTVNKCRLEPDMVLALLLHSCIVGPPSAMMTRRTTLDRVGGFDPAFSQCADWDMWIRLAGIGPIGIVEQPLLRYRKHSANMSNNIRLLESDTMRVLDKFFSHPDNAVAFAIHRDKILSNQYLILSGSYLHARDFSSSIRCLFEATTRTPTSLFRAFGMPARWVQRRLGKIAAQ